MTTLRSTLRFDLMFLAKWRPLVARAFRAVDRHDADPLPELIRQIDEVRTRDGHPRWVRDLIRRGELPILRASAEILRDPGLLDRAVTLGREALTGRPASPEAEAWDRALLAECLVSRFEDRGDRADVDQAIIHLRRAADLCRTLLTAPKVPWRRSSRLWWRDLWDLDHRRPWPPFDRAACFSVLLHFGDVLHTRFEFLRTFDDLRRAVVASEEAEALSRSMRWAVSKGWTDYGQERGAILSQLAALLAQRHQLLRDPQDIVRAVWLLKDADRLMPRRARGGRMLARHRVHALTTMGLALSSPEDFATAEAVLRRRTPHQPEWRPQIEILTGRAGITGSAQGLAEAVAILEAAAPQDRPDTHEALIWLAATLRQWAVHVETQPVEPDVSADQQPDSAPLWRRSSDAWRLAALRETAPAWRRLHAASRWRMQEADRCPGSPEAAEASSLAVRLLPLAAWRGLDRLSQEKVLQSTDFDLASCAAADQLALGDPEHALELLELGRGVLWSQKLDVRTDLKRLQEASPELAERLTRVRVLLEEVRDPSARTGRAGLRLPL
ncbi:hypothetical protein ACFXKG_32720 [Streptomyces sp. NPDC059255]|uniref:hypothetical protein n=1 Tax=Streptomyces sp. NPDC059255 TaxID=3346793 RepID=UPI0036AAEFE2